MYVIAKHSGFTDDTAGKSKSEQSARGRAGKGSLSFYMNAMVPSAVHEPPKVDHA
jgi:hypothetical protein